MGTNSVVPQRLSPPGVGQALRLAGAGMHVFPLIPGGKEPVIKGGRGCLDATTDPTTIYEWWTKYPDANIGTGCGPTGIVTIDVDVRNGKPGMANWQALCQGREIPPTLTVRTPSGGLHLYFRVPPTLNLGNTSGKLGEGIDTRGAGGYVVAPGSVLAGDEEPYAVVLDLPIAAMPQWLVDMLAQVEERPTPGPVRPVEPSGAPLVAEALARVYQHAQELTAAPEGQGTDTANRLAFEAGQYVGAGQADRAQVEEIMLSAIGGWGWRRPGDEQAMRRQIGKSITDGMASPRLWAPTPPRPVLPTLSLPLAVPLPVIGRRHHVLTRASAITPGLVSWLYEGRIAVGTLSLLAGRQGLGKSTFAYWMAARITRGELPGAYAGTPRAVLVCATEDSWEHVIIPRLMAAGADLELVHRVEVATDDHDPQPLDLPVDVDALRAAIEETDAVAVLLDPLLSRVSARLDTHKDAEVRQALEPLTRLAAATLAAILGVMHLNKAGGTEPLTAVMGSTAFSAVARSVSMIVPDPDNDDQRLFATVKNNLGRTDLPTLRFRIESRPVKVAGTTTFVGGIEFTGESDLSIGEAMAETLAANGPSSRSSLQAASTWLEEYLTQHGGGASREQALAAGKELGHAGRTVERAMRQHPKITSERSGMPARAMWILNDDGARPSSSAKGTVLLSRQSPGESSVLAEEEVTCTNAGGTGTVAEPVTPRRQPPARLAEPGADGRGTGLPAGAAGLCVECGGVNPHRYGPGCSAKCPTCLAASEPRT